MHILIRDEHKKRCNKSGAGLTNLFRLVHFAPTQNAPGARGSNLNFLNITVISFQKVIAIIDVLSFFFCSHELYWVKQFLWFEVNQKRGANLYRSTYQ